MPCSRCSTCEIGSKPKTSPSPGTRDSQLFCGAEGWISFSDSAREHFLLGFSYYSAAAEPILNSVEMYGKNAASILVSEQNDS